MAEVVPTITADSTRDYTRQIDQLKPFAKRLHIDIADGLFVDHKLVDLAQIHTIEGVPFDLHLMVLRPDKQLQLAITLRPQLVIIHLEAEGDLKELIRQLRASGVRVGLAIRAETPVSQAASLLTMVDHLLVFTGGRIGYFGGEFRSDCLAKIGQARAINPELEIAVDGGVNVKTARQAVEAGADVLNCGSFIHDAPNPGEAYGRLDAVARGETQT